MQQRTWIKYALAALGGMLAFVSLEIFDLLIGVFPRENNDTLRNSRLHLILIRPGVFLFWTATLFAFTRYSMSLRVYNTLPRHYWQWYTLLAALLFVTIITGAVGIVWAIDFSDFNHLLLNYAVFIVADLYLLSTALQTWVSWHWARLETCSREEGRCMHKYFTQTSGKNNLLDI